MIGVRFSVMRSDEITNIIASEFGANATYVEDLFRRFQVNPQSVDEEWGEYFNSLINGGGNGAAQTPTAAASSAPASVPAQASMPVRAPAPAPAPAQVPDEKAQIERIPIRGAALRIVENMDASLGVPVATSMREIPIKLLDENRRWINRHFASPIAVRPPTRTSLPGQ